MAARSSTSPAQTAELTKSSISQKRNPTPAAGQVWDFTEPNGDFRRGFTITAITRSPFGHPVAVGTMPNGRRRSCGLKRLLDPNLATYIRTNTRPA